MAKKYLVNIDLGGNQLIAARAQNGSASPTAYGKGQLWFDTNANQLNVFDGSSFQPLATGGTAVSSLNGLTGGVTIYGTTNEISVVAGSGSITISLPDTISVTTACATSFYGTLYGNSSSATQASSATFATNASSATFATNSGNSTTTSQTNFSALTISSSNVATQAYVTTASTAFATNASSATFATNASSATFATNSTSATYATNAGNSTTTSQTNFTSLTLSGSNVATQAYVTTASTAFATNASSATFATNSSSATYATNSGNSTTTSQVSFATLTSTGSAQIQSTTESNNASTGALVVSGGVGVAKNVSIGGNLNVSGSVFISGSVFQVSASSIVLNDPLLYLAHDNPANTSDLGIIASFNDGTYQHSGLVRDATDGRWKLFSRVIPEPTTTVDFASATYDVLQTGGLIINSSSVATSASITSAGNAKFVSVDSSSITVSGSTVATQTWVSTSYAPLASPSFTGTVSLGTNIATGSVQFASNSASLGGTAAGSYALLSSANFTSASIGSNRIITVADKFTAAAASVTSAELLAVISNETGSGSLVFNNAPVFTGTVNLGSSTATGSVQFANNSASLGGTAAGSYALLSSANFTAASVGSIAVARKFVSTISGNSSSTSFPITHNMGTQDLTAQVYQTSATPDTQYSEVEVDIVRTSSAVLTVSFATAPTTGVTYNVVIVG